MDTKQRENKEKKGEVEHALHLDFEYFKLQFTKRLWKTLKLLKISANIPSSRQPFLLGTKENSKKAHALSFMVVDDPKVTHATISKKIHQLLLKPLQEMFLNHQPKLKYFSLTITIHNTAIFHCRIRITMKNLLSGDVVDIPMNSAVCSFERQPKRLLSLSSCQDHIVPFVTSKILSKLKQRKSVIGKMSKLGERMDYLAQGIREHVSLSPKLTETVKGKLSLGAKILQVGGLERIFKQKFSVRNDEKLLKVSQCYLSTTAGPMAGLLFISTDKIAFCSERSIKLLSPTGKLLRIRYKVSILCYYRRPCAVIG